MIRYKAPFVKEKMKKLALTTDTKVYNPLSKALGFACGSTQPTNATKAEFLPHILDSASNLHRRKLLCPMERKLGRQCSERTTPV